MKNAFVSLIIILLGTYMIGFAQSGESGYQPGVYIQQIEPWDGSLENIDIPDDLSLTLKDLITQAKSLYSFGAINNKAYGFQDGIGNNLAVSQTGSGHFYFGAQVGSGNTISSTITGQNNLSLTLQNGIGNTITQMLDGTGLGGIIVQDGDNNTYLQELTGNNFLEGYYKVMQSGNSNFLYQVETNGIARPYEVYQSGGAQLILINGSLPSMTLGR